MLSFRNLPEAADSALGIPPPNTWPTLSSTVTSHSLIELDVHLAVTNEWQAWWNHVGANYATARKSRPLGIRSIAHALHLEFTNGWSFEFCLRFCEENLIETAQGISAAPNVNSLTVRGRAMVDETIGSAIAIALAGADGYRFLGDLGRYVTKYPGMVKRRWKGNGPDHLVAKSGTLSDGLVAQYMFLEAKGVAGSIPAKAPRNFYAHKTQSLNAEFEFGCVYKPVLAYAYLPVAIPPEPMVAQWFNARAPQEEKVESKPLQAILLLRVASDQFRRIALKAQLPYPPVPIGSIRLDNDGRLWQISSDGFHAVTVELRALRFFADLDARLNVFQKAYDAARNVEATEGELVMWDGENQLMNMVEDLRDLSLPADRVDRVFLSIDQAPFTVIAQDATGFEFLRRALD
jgi:hypothetical protein